MSEPTNEELLRRVADQRDREAFRMLFDRLAPNVFALCRRMTGSDAMAEDAVQEAMLTVWLKAGRFDPALGSAKSWLLQIAANKTLAASRNTRRAGIREKKFEAMNARTEGGEGSDGSGKQELVTAVHRMLDRLPALPRQILSMYFVGEMSQEEIARALSMPQTTVSIRIRQSLEELRGHLKSAGLAAALPLLSAKEISEALCSGHEVPPGLHERIIEYIAHPVRESLRTSASHSRRAAVAKLGSPALLWAGFATAALAAGVGWWAAGSKPAAPPPPEPDSSTPKKVFPSSSARAESKAEPFFRRWDFNTSVQAQAVKVLSGTWWTHVPDGGPDGSGCMEIASRPFRADLGITQERLPLLMKFWIKVLPSADSRDTTVALYSLTGAIGLGIRSSFSLAEEFSPLREGWIEVHCFVTLEHSSIWRISKRGRELIGVARKDKLGSHETLFLYCHSSHTCRIDNLSVQQISPIDVPDVGERLRAMEPKGNTP